MSTEVVIIIVGAILVLLAIGDSIKPLGLLNAKLRIPLGAIGILLIIYGGYSYGSIHLQGQIEQVAVGKKSPIQYPIEKVQVISPVAGDSVKCRILTMGVYPNSHDKDIWVLLKPSNNKYYPQSDHTNTSYKRDGEWQVITRFGGDKGESYDIIVYETDSIASQFFSKTIQDWKDALLYPGLEFEELPEGAKEVDRLAVYLKNGCRGVF
ncbi:hypothetical protein V8G56_05475 [Gaetbulibacter aquiaggeris]|uniref:DUF2892 domain-containing protein n=1 Tax=Gaetbulibacter aquiaggeris TaxID=1735373 RepID=A0ABW7MMZ2_9FLAO